MFDRDTLRQHRYPPFREIGQEIDQHAARSYARASKECRTRRIIKGLELGDLRFEDRQALQTL